MPVDGRPLDVVGLLQAGAVLLNGRGERFMRRFDPDRLERAPVALLVAAADAEIRAGRCTSRGAVIVDATHLAPDRAEQPMRVEVVPWTRPFVFVDPL